MQFIIVLLLIILNGLFAMAEIALVSIRKSRLQKEANDGDTQAQEAVAVSQNPTKFLSTIQIGITFIGIFDGAFGGEPLSHSLAGELQSFPLIAPYSQPIALFLVVAFITFLSLIIGELVPKRIALTNPEKIAKRMARPMNILSSFAFPLVNLLTYTSDVVIKMLRIKPPAESTVSEEEVTMLIQEGTTAGIFNREERDIVKRTFQLDEKKIISFMTPRKEIIWLDIDSSFKKLRSKILKHQHSYFPVCRDSLDKVLGVVRTEDLLASFLIEEKIDFTKCLHQPIYVPETMEAWKVLELFKRSGVHMALVVDEYGSILGLLSLADILEEIVGDIPNIDELKEQDIVKRDDGTYLVDGLTAVSEFKSYFAIAKLPGERSGAFHTIGGFAMDRLDRVPTEDDRFEFNKYQFKIISMDGNRVDKILVKPFKDE